MGDAVLLVKPLAGQVRTDFQVIMALLALNGRVVASLIERDSGGAIGKRRTSKPYECGKVYLLHLSMV